MEEREESQGTPHAKCRLTSNSNKVSHRVKHLTAVALCPSTKVLSERQHQLRIKLQKNYEAQEESRRRRKELIQKLEGEGSQMPEERETQRLPLRKVTRV